MKICFFTTTIYGDGGVSRVLSVLANALADKHDITIVTLENKENENREKYNLSDKINVNHMKNIYSKCYFRRFLHKVNQKTDFLGKIGIDFLWEFVYIPSKLKKQWSQYIIENNFDVVIGVQGKPAYILGSISEQVNCKTIGWQHNSYEAYLENPQKNYYWNQDYLFEKYIPRLSEYVVLNEHDEEMYRKKKKIRTTTIYNPRSFVSKEKSKLIQKRFIGVGGLRTAKGFDLLIEAFEIFAQHNDDWVLDIYGDGPDKIKLQELIKIKKLEDRVILRGVTDNINNKMLTASALLLSSRWEGMPMVVLEALECGLPIISFDITAIKPLVDNNIEGIIVPKFNIREFSMAMEKISDNYSERQMMGKNAAAKSERFSIEKIVEQWEILFLK